MKNFEKFKTPLERGRAFRNFCSHGCAGCGLSRVSSKLSDCPMLWLELKAEEDELLPCPFCGGEVVIGETSYKGQIRLHQAWCKNFKQCDYNGAKKSTALEAIAAHNLVAKAVMDAKEIEAK